MNMNLQENKYASLHTHTMCSLLDGISKPKQIAKRCSEIGMSACAITDHGNVSMAPTFCKELAKKNIKPILGVEAYITFDSIETKNRNLSHQILLAKNLQGWKKIISLVSTSNDDEHFYYKPRISFNDIEKINPNGDIISFSGHPGSTLYNMAMIDENSALHFVYEMQELFGIENFFVEAQTIYSKDFVGTIKDVDRIRAIAFKSGAKIIATGDAHYTYKSQAVDQQLVLCSMLNTTIGNVNKSLKNQEQFALEGFFKSDNFHIPSYDEFIQSGNTEEELRNTGLVADMCEDYNITSQPIPPEYIWTNGMSEKQFLEHLCNIGLKNRGFDKRNNYHDRLKQELEVFNKANLAGYFLVVQDYVQWAKNNGILVGPSRGCFLPDTRVKMADGMYKPISTIKVGDKVVDAYGDNQEVYDLLEYDVEEEILELEFENGIIIRCTKDHKFLTRNRGFVEAQYLTESDDIVEI